MTKFMEQQFDSRCSKVKKIIQPLTSIYIIKSNFVTDEIILKFILKLHLNLNLEIKIKVV